MRKPKCPRCGKESAIIHRAYGVLHCQKCQDKDVLINTGRKFEFASIGKLDRVQRQRDKHGKDLLQPFVGMKPNLDFFKAYPEKVKVYGVEEELKRM